MFVKQKMLDKFDNKNIKDLIKKDIKSYRKLERKLAKTPLKPRSKNTLEEKILNRKLVSTINTYNKASNRSVPNIRTKDNSK